MKLTFLGTSASEGFPDAFCACPNCEQARRLGGPSLRKRSAALINDDLLLDLGPDLMAAALMHAVPLTRVASILLTHEHHDHLDASHLVSRSALSGVLDAPHLHLYASAGALRKAASRIGGHLPEAGLLDPTVGQRLNLTAHPIEPFMTFEVGPYRVTSLRAAHDPDAITAMLYIIERDGRALFYATDTGPLPEATWRALAESGVRLNVVAMDHTFGFQGRATGHMNAEQFLEQIARLRDLGLLAPEARLFAHHLGHHSHPAHPDLAAHAARHGYEIAFDGLTIAV
jgi:phosphoribosyl 1,2-cyclic phosphate phosphodiesterase